MADVFISYSHDEKEKIIPIVEGLRALGVTVWYDIRIQPGTSFDEVIGAELDTAKAILVCWSPASVRSKWVRSEATVAQDQKTIVPCFIEPCSLRPPFNLTQAENLIGWDGAPDHLGWRKIVEQIGVLLQRPGLVPLLDAKASADPEKLADWANLYPEDPYVNDAWASWKKDEQQRFAEEMRTLRQQAEAQRKQQESSLRAEIANFEAAYNSWISTRRGAGSENRPEVPNLADAPPLQMNNAVRIDLETKLEKATKNVADQEKQVAAGLAIIDDLRANSLPRRKSIALGVVACLLGAIGGGSIGHLFHEEPTVISGQVNELTERINLLNSERDSLNKQLAESLAASKAAAITNEQRIAQQKSEFDSKLRDANAARDEALGEAKNAKNVANAVQEKLNGATLQIQQLQLEKERAANSQVTPPTVAPVAKNEVNDDSRTSPPGNSGSPSRKIGYQSYDNLDLEGGDIDTLRNVEIQECRASCGQNSRCQVYSFDKWNRICFLKSNAGVLKLNPRSITYIRDDIPPPSKSTGIITIERYRGKAFPGNGYKNTNTKNMEACEEMCRRENACVAYTFQGDDRICHLFNTTGEYFRNTIAESGGKRQ